MQIVKLICDFFTSFIQVLSLAIVCNTFGESKISNKKEFYLLSFLFVSLMALTTYFVKMQIVFITAILLLFFCFSLLYKITKLKRIFIVLLINIISSLLEIIFGLIMTVIYKVSIEDIQNNMILYIQAILISKLTLFIVASILSHIFNDKNGKIKSWIILSLCVIPLSTFIVMYTISLFTYENNNEKIQILSIVSSFVLIISNLFIFYIFEYIEKQSYRESELKFKEVLFNNEKQYYKNLLNHEYISNKTIHDLKNELFAIKEILNNNPDGAYKEINKICNIVDENKPIIISQSDAVNSLISVKVDLAKSKGINVDIKAFVSDISINSIDMCIILGNLFDNAIEACDLVDENKKISLELKSNCNFISIVMSNTTINDRVDIGKTTKKNAHQHGFGLSNINEIIKKNNGFIDYSIANNVFTIKIIIEVKEK